MASSQTATLVSFLPTAVDICLSRGDNPTIPVAVTSDAVAVDITGATFIMTVDPAPDPTDNTANLFSVTGVINGAPTLGLVDFTPTVVDTDQLPSTYFYDIEMVHPTIGRRTILKGKFIISQEITK